MVEGGCYFFKCKLTLRLGRIAWIFCLNPEFGFGFTLLGTKKDHTYPPLEMRSSFCYFRLRHFGGIHSLRNSVIKPRKTEKPKRWSQSENMNLRELTTEGRKQMVQLLISSDLLELSTEPPLRVSF